MVGLKDLLYWDRYLVQTVSELRTYIATEFFSAITAFGSVAATLVLFTGLWTTGEKRTARNGIVAGLTTAVVVKGLKVMIARARPDYAVHDLFVGASSYAFPSGHSALAFATATVLAARFSNPVFFYGIAVLVALSRVYLGVHYTTDVVAGGLIGLLIGNMVVQQESRFPSRTQLRQVLSARLLR